MLEVYQSENLQLPHIRHGFFSRKGGVSEGVYHGLNVGPGSHDARDAVLENRRRVAEWFGQAQDKLFTLHQVHSAKVVTVDADFRQRERQEADGFVTNQAGVILGILTADCGPVLFADGKNRVIGACHAGWKGAIQNIMEKTIVAMEKLGAERQHIHAALGPCIAQASYEVGAEFREHFLEQSHENAAFFIASEIACDKSHFDLGGYIKAQLRKSGIASVNLLAKDTCLLENTFFSNRRKTLRGESDYGRQVSAIMLEA